METIILLTLIFCSALAGLICSKLCSNILTKKGVIENALFILMNGTTACFLFLSFAGFHLEITLSTLLLALLYGAFCVCSLMFGMIIYRYGDISNVSVSRSSLILIFTSLIGIVAFGENITLSKFIRIALVLLAMFFVFLECRPDKTAVGNVKTLPGSTSADKSRFIRFALCLTVLILCGCYSSIQSKLLASADIIPDMNSFFFMVNLIMVAGALLVLAFCALCRKDEFSGALCFIKPRNILPMFGNTISSNISSILGVWILKYMDVSVYSPIGSAISILSGAAASLIFHEHMGMFAWLSVLFAAIAVMI